MLDPWRYQRCKKMCARVSVSSGRNRRVKVWRWFGFEKIRTNEAVRALVFSPEMGSLVIMMSRDPSWGWDTQPDIHHTITFTICNRIYQGNYKILFTRWEKSLTLKCISWMFRSFWKAKLPIETFYLNTIEQLYLFVEQLEHLEVCLPKGPPQLKKSLKFQLLAEIFWTPSLHTY